MLQEGWLRESAMQRQGAGVTLISVNVPWLQLSELLSFCGSPWTQRTSGWSTAGGLRLNKMYVHCCSSICVGKGRKICNQLHNLTLKCFCLTEQAYPTNRVPLKRASLPPSTGMVGSLTIKLDKTYGVKVSSTLKYV